MTPGIAGVYYLENSDVWGKGYQDWSIGGFDVLRRGICAGAW